MPSSSAGKPTVLCAGIAVQDLLFKVDTFPPPGGKTMTHDFLNVCGGCAVNAAIAVARLGGLAKESLEGQAAEFQRTGRPPIL